MHTRSCPPSRLQRAAVLLAALAGITSLVAGGSVLLGLRTPNHGIIGSLLAFNTAMGAVYVAAAVLIRIDPRRGRTLAGTLVVLNLLVTGVLIAFARGGAYVATDSFGAMTIRTVLWGIIYLALARLTSGHANRRSAARAEPA